MADATQRLLLLIDGKANGAKAAIDQTTKSVDAASKKIQASGNRMSSFGKGLASAFVALGAAAFLKKGIESAIKAEASTARLKNAVDQTGTSYASQEKSIRATIRAESDLAAVGAGDLRSAMTALTQTTGSAAEAQKLLGITADLARAKNISLEAAAKLVGKVAMGNTSALTRYGIVLEKGATATEALAAMQQKFGGAAKAYGQTTAGQMDLANIAIARLQTTIGTAMLPTIGRFASKTADLLNKFEELPQGTKDATVAIGAVGTAAVVATPYVKSFALALKGLGVASGGTYVFGGAAVVASGFAFNKAVSMGSLSLGAFGEKAGLSAEFSKKFGAELIRFGGLVTPMTQQVALAGRALDFWGQALERVHKEHLGLIKPDTITSASLAMHQGRVAADALKAGVDGVDASFDDGAASADSMTRALNGVMVASDSLAGTERTALEASLASKTANLDLKAARTANAEAVKKYGANSDEAKRAQINLTQAELRAKDASVDLAKATSDFASKTGDAKAKAQQLADKMNAIRTSANNAAAALDKMYGAGAGAATRAAAAYGGAGRASGSIDAPRPGGVNVTVAEAGDYEATIPINRSTRSMRLWAETGRRLGLTGGTSTVNQFNITGSRIDADWIAETARRVMLTPPVPRIA